jgi:hypothetical protein
MIAVLAPVALQKFSFANVFGAGQLDVFVEPEHALDSFHYAEIVQQNIKMNAAAGIAAKTKGL